MLQSLIDKASQSASAVLHKADSIVGGYVNRALIALPFVIATGFGTAALTIKISEYYGAAAACASVALLFVAAGAVTAAALKGSARNNALSNSSSVEVARLSAREQSANPPVGMDREELMALLTTLAPIAIPAARVILGKRSFFILGALGAAALAFTMLRQQQTQVHQQPYKANGAKSPPVS